MPVPRSTPLSVLASTTDRQIGLFTLAQSAALGVHKSMLDRRVRSGEVVRVDYDVFRSVLTPPSWRQRLLAACLAGPAVGSHRSAGVLWRVPIDAVDPLEVTALRHRRRRAPDVTWHESYLLDGCVSEVDGIPVTTPARTVLDLAGVLDPAALQRVVDDVVRRRLASIESLGRLLDRLGPKRRGVTTMRAVLEARSGAVPESDLETRFELLIRERGLPRPVAQHPVQAPDGRRFRLDFAFPEHRVGVELLGAEFHSGPDQWRNDTERLGILAAMGWHMLAFTYDQVSYQEATVVQALDAALGRSRR